MVVLKEIGSQKMFWGVTLDGGKRYTQTVERSFHISMAALEPPTSKVGVMVSVDKAEFLLCSLGYNGVLQQPLDLMFTEGEEVTFFLNGSGVVHLTGYLVEDQPEDLQGLYDDSDEAPELVGDSEEESDEDEEDSMAVVKSMGTKRKMKEVGKVAKKAKLSQLDSDDDDDDEDDDYDSEDMSALDFLDDEASEDSDDEMDEDDFDEDLDEDEDSEEEYVKKTPGKTPNKSPQKKGTNSTPVQNKDTPRPVEKKQTPSKPGQQTPKQSPGKPGQQTPKQTPGKDNQQTPKQSPGKGKQTPGGEQKPQNTETPNTEGKKKKKKKKNKNKGDDSVNEASTPKPGSATPGKKVMSGGIVMEETKSGHGPEAKSGKMVSVYYVGKLSSNGKQFDSCTQGKPFRFRLGKNEVIKGWDVGLQGMKVGGKRRLTIPPQQAYGNAKVGHIPASSTLVFDVELKAVN